MLVNEKWFIDVKNLILDHVSECNKEKFNIEFNLYIKTPQTLSYSIKTSFIHMMLNINNNILEELLTKDISDNIKAIINENIKNNAQLTDKTSDKTKSMVRFADIFANASTGSTRALAKCCEAASWATFLLDYSTDCIIDAVVESVEVFVRSAEYFALESEKELKIARQKSWEQATIKEWRDALIKTNALEKQVEAQKTIVKLASTKAYDIYAVQLLDLLHLLQLGENHVSKAAV